jgi:predicted transposase/invertase (TIGR01784 family)
MKTDVIFYEIFREFPSIFFELLGQPETNANAYQFSSPEIKQLSFRLDGVFSPLADNSTEPRYFVEVQFYKDKNFYDRLFASIFLYFHQYQPTCPDWYAIVIYPSRRHASTLPSRYNGIAPRHLREIYLDELESPPQSLGIGIVKLVIESGNPAKEFAQQLAAQAKQELTDTVIQKRVLQFIETIVLYKFPSLTPKEIEAMLSVSLLKGTRVYQEIKAEVKEEIEEEIRKALTKEVKEEVEQKIKQQVEQKVKEEVEQKIKQQVEQKVKEEIREEIREEIKQEATLNTQLELALRLLEKGMSIQEVAELIEWDEDTLRDQL